MWHRYVIEESYYQPRVLELVQAIVALWTTPAAEAAARKLHRAFTARYQVSPATVPLLSFVRSKQDGRVRPPFFAELPLHS